MAIIKGLSLSTGYGGLDRGLEAIFPMEFLEFEVFCEIEAFPIANLIAKMEQGFIKATPIWTDLKTFPYKQFKNKIDLVCAGFPCQPFSVAGRRDGQRSPKHLWPHIYRGIKELGKPSIVFLENVHNIINMALEEAEENSPAGTNVVKHILDHLAGIGYVVTVGAFSALAVGATHQRRRVFFLAIHRDAVESDLIKTASEFVEHHLEDWVNVKEFLEEYPEFKQAPILKDNLDVSDVILEHFHFEYARVKQGFPANKTQKQFAWEPPRLIRKGWGGWRDCETEDSIGDELKMLGNGVVPAQATEAFCTLFRDLIPHRP